jgi:hypothetical protein
MGGVAFWMAEQICPLLPYLGLHACTTGTDLYLVGVAGWIFGGIALLMLMGISEEMESRKVAPKKHVAQNPHRAPSSTQLAIIEPTRRPNNHSLAASHFTHRRIRPLKRLPSDKLADKSQHRQS